MNIGPDIKVSFKCRLTNAINSVWIVG